MSARSPDMTLSSSLESLTTTGGYWLWKSRLRDGLRARLPKAAVLLLLVPALAIGIIAIGWLLGTPWKPSMGWAAALCPLPALVYLGYHAVRIWKARPSRRESLAVYDEALGLKDRLQTADEFLSATERSNFMEAAIDDAKPALDQASGSQLEWTWGKPWIEWRLVVSMALLAVLLLVLGVFLPTFTRSGPAAELSEDGQTASLGNPNPPEETTPTTPEQPPINQSEPKPEKPEALVRKANRGKPAPAQVNENPSSQLAGREKKSIGTSEGGQTSQAASSGRASQSKGMPGSQAPASNPEKQSAAKKKDPKATKDEESEPDPKKVEDQSGATAGRGSSGGSSKNPASSDWASKDRTESADNEEFEQEEEVDDEESESEARGGLQPNLRDRRPPVNRDLGIGFGTQPSPDANGRGGPSARKKSRGVAGLVLGVPIPDHVKGQANPGRVKVNQERVQPQGEEMPGAEAEDRGQRSSPAGHLSERTLDASMRHIVREYFLQNQNLTLPESEESED
ncbi:MAG: hypothetical protein AB8D78_01805 [Akkermansiaceae bacterium]